MTNDEDGAPPAPESPGAEPGAGPGVASALPGFAPAFSLDLRISGSMMPKSALDPSAAFTAAGAEADALVFGLPTLHTSPSTRASSAPTKLPATASVRQFVNCWF